METVLLIVTLISVSMAVVSFMYARRAHRRERERSEARIAALSAAADSPAADAGGWTQAAGEWRWTAEPAGPVVIGDQRSGARTRAEGAIRVTEPIPNHETPVTAP